MYKPYETSFRNQSMTIREKLYNISFSYVMFIVILAAIGIVMLYSAANGNWSPWAINQLIRFGMGFAVMIVLALTDIKLLLRYAYVFYFITLILLVVVEVAGHTGMGATRWINLGFIKLQPSEFMKIAMVLVLARYFHTSSLQSIESVRGIIPPLLMAIFPAFLIVLQPDLGTALMLIFTTAAMFFVVGVQIWKFVVVFIGGLITIPFAWHFLHDYQQNRVLTFLNPERDPLGAGYHIIQSKIALGSGGVFGKGFLKGSQSHLNFLPEKHTDFIFTMLSEEFGLVGAVLVVILNILILAYSYSFALKSTSYFGKLLAIGLATNYFMYVFINIAMVLGLLPVVGIPLPLISYGGTVMLSIMASFGIILCVHINRNVPLGKD
ncbi:MAG: rod shape-determining protein RodA [Alphaproteobacteria bacterium]|jgi:rod shape-determining protein rodA|uniref:rod shape-determining protein RodA n=1 Tax=Candidatus Scatocola faecigallinarum TaxID=2840916 RepID=UPI00033DBCB0|nr:rod shape-determining protein RodA [Alphaproteobacteria bacterium]CDB53354.1 rod shape-determining protein RodA [Azospirillum sp. CAG:239]